MKTKILHITQSLGGVRTYLENILTYSDDEQFTHVIVAPEHFEFQEFCKERSITYYPIKIQRSINLVKDVRAFFQILSILKNESPQIIQTHSAKGGFIGRLAAKFSKAKVIYTPHAFSYLSFTGIKRMIFYVLESVSKPWTDVLLSVSYSEANRARFELGYIETKTKTILNAIPVSTTLPFRNYQKCIHVGMIGRLTYQKNPLLFLNIAKELTDRYPYLVFSILGAGLTDHLATDIADFVATNDLKEKVNIYNWGEAETSEKFLMDTDLFVLTSVFEGLPLSLLEAMSHGIPCVVSKVDGNTDVIQNNENGFSCLTLNEFKSKLIDLIENEDIRRKFGQAGHRYVADVHEINKNILLLEKLYLDLVADEYLDEVYDGGDMVEDTNGRIEKLNLKISPSI